MPSPVNIRDGGPSDAERLVPLYDALGYPTDKDTLESRLAAMFAQDPSARLLVAESGGAVVGFACLHETPAPHRPTAVGRITAIAVLPGTRGTGAGRALVETAERHFAARGLCRIEVTSGDNHAAAHPFYVRLGYSDQGIRFAKPLVIVPKG